MLKFKVIDPKTGKEPDLEDIIKEGWADDLKFSKIDGFILHEDGYLLLMSRCGEVVAVPADRYKIIFEPVENKPLTADELKEMAGLPYYHVSLQKDKSHWTILDSFVAKCPEDYGYGERWLAYRFQPDTVMEV